MSDERKMTETIGDVPSPVLTLNPFGQEAAAPVVKEEAPLDKIQIDESLLSPEEQKLVDDFAATIDLTDTVAILQYGAGAQKKMADFAEGTLENVRSKDLGEVGALLSNLVGELRDFGEPEEKGFLGIFKRGANKLENMKNRYAKAESNVNKIAETLEGHQVVLLKDMAMMDKMYDTNLAYYKELTMYILAGKKKLNQVLTEDLPALQEKAKASGLPEDAQAANDLAAVCNRFEKKLYDLDLSRTIAMQTAPQIRLVQNNDTVMSEKIQSTLVNTIPLWKSQMVLALGITHSQQAAEAQREVTNMTNELLKKNADTLKMATIETARESERGIVDLETLRHTNESLISTLDEVVRIQEEGRVKRRDAEAELLKMENDLKNKLLEIRG